MGNRNKQQKFLFFDNRLYEYIYGFRRGQCQAEKYAGNPILVPEQPNEFKQAHFPGSVMYDGDEKLYKLWYSSNYYVGLDDSVPEAKAHFNYAYSSDGVNFVKPKLDIVPDTNIVLPDALRPHGPSVIKDEDEPDPARRYKLVMSPYNRERALVMFVSPDGAHWAESEPAPFLNPYSDCHIGFYCDPDTGLYRVSMRMRSPDRRIWISESHDCKTWSRPVLAMEPDASDSCSVQFYGMQMTPYGEYIIGLLHVYKTFDYSQSPGALKMFGTIDVHLAYSRGGYCWHRGGRLIPLGYKGEWDSQCVGPSSTIVYAKDKMLLYYSGNAADHGAMATMPYDEVPKSCIGLAAMRPDGFVCLDADEDACELMTRTFICKKGEMYVNANARGMLVAEICDAEGNALPGFTFKDCKPFSGDSICAALNWTGNPAAIENKPIRVKMRLQRGSLYSFFFPNGEDPAVYWRFREISCLDPKFDFEDMLFERRIGDAWCLKC